MSKIIRTNEQIETLATAIKAETDALPEYNFFGESTQESKHEGYGWVTELRYALETGNVKSTGSEVEYWLTREGSFFGKDYGVE